MEPVVVTTEHRGVFFGYVDPAARSADPIRLERARMCVYWSSDLKGVLGLAATGPNAECRIGPEVPSILLSKITSVMELTPEAVAAWEKAPWSIR